jgi:membrane protein DedA with SNARE-associated domain
LPAGVFRARFGPYVWLTLLGSAIWCFAFAGAGWARGANWESFHEAFRYVDYLVVGRRRRRGRAGSDGA